MGPQVGTTDAETEVLSHDFERSDFNVSSFKPGHNIRWHDSSVDGWNSALRCIQLHFSPILFTVACVVEGKSDLLVI